MNDIVTDLVSRLPNDLKEEFEERAAICFADAHLSIDHAECFALLCVLRANPDALMRNQTAQQTVSFNEGKKTDG